jgi:hypothetical protein
MDREVQFHWITLPEGDPDEEPPWNSQSPWTGSLDPHDAGALAEVLRRHTAAADDCWFCYWDGYGWDRKVAFTFPGEPGGPMPDPIPAEVRAGPRVTQPHRSYLLCSGPIEGALAFVETERQTPNIWWPADRSWCVATEIDMPWTYVGGSRSLIDDLLGAPMLETLPVEPGDSVWHKIDPRLSALTARATEELSATGSARVATYWGSLELSVSDAWFTSRTMRRDGGGNAGRSRIPKGPDDQRHGVVARCVEGAVVSLVEGG